MNNLTLFVQNFLTLFGLAFLSLIPTCLAKKEDMDDTGDDNEKKKTSDEKQDVNVKTA